jgi:hypothetical protein
MSTRPDDERLLDLLQRWEEARDQGRDIPAEDLCAECPELAAELDRRIRQLRAMEAPLETREALGPLSAAVRTDPSGSPQPASTLTKRDLWSAWPDFSERARKPRKSLE